MRRRVAPIGRHHHFPPLSKTKLLIFNTIDLTEPSIARFTTATPDKEGGSIIWENSFEAFSLSRPDLYGPTQILNKRPCKTPTPTNIWKGI